MSKSFSIAIDGLHFQITCEYDSLIEKCKDYIVNSTPEDIPLDVRDGAFLGKEEQRTLSDPREREVISALCGVSAEALKRKHMLVHGACMVYGDKAYLFMAPSGTGKSTQLSLWKKTLGDKIWILNGDKPLLSCEEEILVHGTPWMGKEYWGCNRSAPLGGIFLLKRSADFASMDDLYQQKGDNRIRKASLGETMRFLLGQIFLFDRPENSLPILENLGQILSKVPVWEFYCDQSEDAVYCCKEAIEA